MTQTNFETPRKAAFTFAALVEANIAAGMTNDQAQLAASRVVDAVAQHQNGASDASKQHRISTQLYRLTWYIARTTRYATDKRYGYDCARGGMPYSKLLKLMAIPAPEFATLINAAVRDQIIRLDGHLVRLGDNA